MKKIAISLINNNEIINNNEEFYKKLQNEGYELVIFGEGDFSKKDNPIAMVLELLDQIEQVREDVIVILISNIAEYIISIFRCFQRQIDAFVYLFDHTNLRYMDESHDYSKFLFDMTNFVSINNEFISKRIFLNINDYSYKSLNMFLSSANRYLFFDDIKNLFTTNLIPEDPKEKFNYTKEYGFGENVYTIGFNNLIDEHVEIDPDDKSYPEFHNDFDNYMYFFERKLVEAAKQTVLTMNLKEESKPQLILRLKNELRNKSISFAERVRLLRSLERVSLNSEDRFFVSDQLTKLFLKTKTNVDTLYSELFLNKILEFTSNAKLSEYTIANSKYIMDKVLTHYNIHLDKQRNVINPNKDSLKIAIFTTQLLSLFHSPTMFILEFAKNMKIFHPNYEIEIYVEDSGVFRENEKVTFDILYNYFDSSSSIPTHTKYLNGTGISVKYSDTSLTLKERLKNTLESVHEFDPDVIFSTSTVSLPVAKLYEYYPVNYQTFGNLNYECPFDTYTVFGEGQLDHTKSMNNNQPSVIIDESKLFMIDSPNVNLVSHTKTLQRNYYDLSDDAFLMVSVGNRLKSELPVDYIDMICTFLNEHTDAHWLLIGLENLSYISESYADLVDQRKIIFSGYEKSLYSVYQLCDIYLNPPRAGGGGSVSMALREGLPCVVYLGSQDGASVVGYDHCVEDNTQAYMDRVNKLYSDKAFRDSESEKSKVIANKKKSYKTYCSEMDEHFRTKTIVNFNKRISNS